MYTRITCIILFMLVFKINSSAQKKQDSIRHHKNAVYLELGGPTLLYSLGYERTWYKNNWFASISSVGFSYIPDGITMGYIEPGVLFRHKNLALELGIALMNYKERPHHGEQFGTSDGSGAAKMLFLCPRLGVRFFTRNQRLHFRAGITPNSEIWNNEPKTWHQDRSLYFWANVFTIGYRF